MRLISCDQSTLFLATPSAQFLNAILCDGERLFAEEALDGASRCVIGFDSIGRRLPPASAARAGSQKLQYMRY